MKILILDNYDSFTYNLVHLLEKVCEYDIEVHRNDKISLDDVEKFDRIVLSPGPGVPSESGILISLIKRYASSKPILGVCLGNQAIAEAFGGKLLNLEKVYHGVETPIKVIKDDFLFKCLPETFKVGRYHSWIIDPEYLPDSLEITAIDENNQIMAIRHKEYNVRGVQFHPESIMTEFGEELISNWLKS